MSTKKRKSRKHSRSSKLNAKLYAIMSGKTHRVVARTKKLTTARKRARGLVKRGSKHVSIRRGGTSFGLAAARKRRSKRRTSRKGASRRRVSRNGRRRSKRRVSRNGRKRRRSKRRVSRNGRRRRSHRRVSRNGKRRRRTSR